MGITRLSKSLSGKSSINIPTAAMDKESAHDPNTAYDERNIARKHVRLPAAVFPCVNGMIHCPNIFPERLASPSPNASAKIPAVAVL